MSDAPTTPSVTFDVFGRSDVGLMRTGNEDNFAVADLDTGEALTFDEPQRVTGAGRGPLVVVCDGMGGAAAGEIASSLAVEVVCAEMRQAPATSERLEYARLLRRAVRAANRRVWEEGAGNWKLKGMGTTLSAVGRVGAELVLAQIGDSRGYILRGDTLVQVTRDQSIVSALLHAGKITEAEAAKFAQANVILQALGVAEDVEVALSVVELRRGDRLLVCSDGLCGPVDDEEIAAVLIESRDPRAAVDALVGRANDAGGPDNITVVVGDFDGDGLEPAASPEDLPKFVEIDPTEEGERAISTTSKVARRLAAQAGVTDGPRSREIPATSQHRVVDGGPATDRLAQRSRLGAWAWVLAVAVAVAIGAAWWWWRP